MAIKSFTYNGISTRDLGLVIQASPSFQIPEKDYTITHIPGRSGDVAIYNGCYKNFTRTYNVAMVYTEEGNRVFPWNNTALANRLKTVTDFRERAKEVAKWLTTPTGYANLTDDFEPYVTFKAVYYSNMELQNFLNQGCAFNITFECQPVKYYQSGLKIGDDIYAERTAFTGGGSTPTLTFSQGTYPFIELDNVRIASTYYDSMYGCELIITANTGGRVGKIVFARDSIIAGSWKNIEINWYTNTIKNDAGTNLNGLYDIYLGESSTVYSQNLADLNLINKTNVNIILKDGSTWLTAINGYMSKLVPNITTGNSVIPIQLSQTINNDNCNLEAMIDITFSSTFKNNYLVCADINNNTIFRIQSDNDSGNTITGLTINYKTGSILTKPNSNLYKHISLYDASGNTINTLPSISDKGIKFLSNNTNISLFTIQKNEWTLW